MVNRVHTGGTVSEVPKKKSERCRQQSQAFDRCKFLTQSNLSHVGWKGSSFKRVHFLLFNPSITRNYRKPVKDTTAFLFPLSLFVSANIVASHMMTPPANRSSHGPLRQLVINRFVPLTRSARAYLKLSQILAQS